MLTSFKAALYALLLIPSLLLSTPATAADSPGVTQDMQDKPAAVQPKPAKEEKKGLLDKLKFWSDDEKQDPPPAKAEEAAPKEEKGLLDKLKFWGDDEKEAPKPETKTAPVPTPAAEPKPETKTAPVPTPAAEPKPETRAAPVVKLKPKPEPNTAKPEAKPAPAKTERPAKSEKAAPKASPTTPSEVTQVDRIVAVVDNDVITRNELLDRMKTVLEQLEKQGTPLPPEDVLQKQLLERLITDRLQLQLAAQTGLRVDDNQLDKTMERIAEQNKLSLSQFREALERDGIHFSKFREDIRREIIMARLREREVDNRITVTEAEIDNTLINQASKKDSDEFEIAHILVRAPEGGTPEELQKLRAKAEDALKKLQSGVDFGQVSASFSDAPNALEGGKLGWKTATQLPKLFLDAVKTMKAGEVTPILRSPNGFHIIKLLDRRGGSSPLIVQQTHARHILVKPSELLSEADAKHRIDDIKERLDNGADFAELARLHSEDGTAGNGGDLGWANPGDMVPEFEETMNKLKPGEISAPVRSPFGWHVIQVIERRSQDMSKESARLKARQEIKARKSDEAYQDWLRELRDRAFVEYHLEDKY